MQKERGKKVGKKWRKLIWQQSCYKEKKKKWPRTELAGYLGVSKAAISKWETSRVILTLPCFTNCCVFQYQYWWTLRILSTAWGRDPQYLPEFLSGIYKQPFETVYKKCQELIARYYSCYSFLLQMGILLLNHFGNGWWWRTDPWWLRKTGFCWED